MRWMRGLLRVIICGGRDFGDGVEACRVLDAINRQTRIGMVFHGNARGADQMAAYWADSRSIPCHAVPAQWKKHGKSAGPIRNRQMLDQGVDLVIAFPGGRGTADMIRQAKNAGVKVIEPLPHSDTKRK